MPAIDRLIDNIERVVIGRPEAVRLAVIGLLAEGHVLLEDAPGTGKTTLARAFACRAADARPAPLAAADGLRVLTAACRGRS